MSSIHQESPKYAENHYAITSQSSQTSLLWSQSSVLQKHTAASHGRQYTRWFEGTKACQSSFKQHIGGATLSENCVLQQEVGGPHLLQRQPEECHKGPQSHHSYTPW